jgi:hypothetical protein
VPPVDRSLNFETHVPPFRNAIYLVAFLEKPYYSSKQNQHEALKKKLGVEGVKL